MPTFFEGAVGRTVGCLDESTNGTTTLIETTPEVSWDSQQSIITRVTLSHQGNFQFLHTMGNDVYIYVFGDRIGQITISGLSMAGTCSSGMFSAKHGFEQMLDWYKENRLAARKYPVQVSIGQSAMEVFVTGINGDLVDPATRIMQYQLQTVLLPEKQ